MVSSKNKAFQLKGSLFTITVMQLFHAKLALLDEQLEITVKNAPNFFNNAPIIIDLQLMSEHEGALDFDTLKSTLRKYHLQPVAVRGGNESHHQAAVASGLAIFNNYKEDETRKMSAPNSNNKKSPASNHRRSSITITDPIRSGQQVYAKDCDLIVLSQVSHGAEILADGNIHVYGSLRGRVLAGINGNEQARIFCKYLDAELISIAGYYLVAEKLKLYNQKPQQMVYLENQQLKFTFL